MNGLSNVSVLRETEQIIWLANWMDFVSVGKPHPDRLRTRSEIYAVMIKSGKEPARITEAFKRLRDRKSPVLALCGA
jgi:hypothetical protein